MKSRSMADATREERRRMDGERDTITRAFKGILVVQVMSMLVGIAGCVIDGMIIGRFLGEDAMAAFGFASSVTLIPAIAATILGTGASVVCSRSLGKGSLEQTRARFSACFSATAVICALLALLIASLAVPAARLVGARGALSPMAADYIRGYGFACPGIVLVALLMPLMQMDGEMKRLLAAVVAMTAGDIAADLMNVLVFHGGMLGMALATAFSYALALGILLPHLWKSGAIFSRPAFALDRDTTVNMIAEGFPTATNQLGRLLLTFLLNRYLLSLGGSIAVAAHAVIMSAANLCMVPGSALGASTQMITGVLYGEEDRRQLTGLMRAAMRCNLLLNGGGTLLFLALAAPIAGLFYKGSPDGLRLAVAGFRFFALSMGFYGLNSTLRSFLQSAGKAGATYAITFLDGFLGPLAAALLLGSLLGIPAVWLCYALGEGLASALALVALKRGNPNARGVGAMVPFPEGFGGNIEALMEGSVCENDMSRVAALSREAEAFARANGSDSRTAYCIGLAVEEAAGNALEYGFADGKPHRIELRLLKKEGAWVLRLRDDCPLFNPRDYLDQFAGSDPAANIGLKLLYGTAADVTYLNALKLNNLLIRMKRPEEKE